ncbi:MAG: orotate phosphoribosyltransferase [Candidatus Eremiobacteraeota bacterium]|nr:orotate phosphoribosyltransferase [Candidatus Eremiobacteraeota bacterium]MBV9647474.1 orotate phosphoribosyltransferase [Candidatus Eremiobacteraeota bacterium]
MSSDALRSTLASSGALLEGHFRLSSGRHSDRFVQKFRLLEDPRLLEPFARELALRLSPYEPEIVVSAAVGGIILGYEVARALGSKAIFVEKESGAVVLRRNFVLRSGARAAIVEDVITTGGSVREVIEVVRSHDARPVVAGALVRRSPVDLGVPTVVLLELPIESYEAAECPQCRTGVPISEPGSRFVSAAP